MASAEGTTEAREGGSVIAASAAMREVHALAERVAPAELPVLIRGPTGTGKEVLARYIHERSPRATKPLMSINCGAIPQTLIESQLFGHEKGAFTGADRMMPGIFEQADGGTVLLDEVGELSQAAQAALLRVLESRRLMRVGGTKEIEVDIRLLAATHRDLEAMVKEGSFRMDLLYRLNAMTLTLLPLAERPDDIEPLARLFLEEAARAAGTRVRKLDDKALGHLRRYAWPGNVRELRNVIERAVILSSGDTIHVEDLSERVQGKGGPMTTVRPGGDSGAGFKDRVKQFETELILDALRRAGGNQTQAAKLLDMPLRTLVHKIKAYAIKKTYGAD